MPPVFIKIEQNHLKEAVELENLCFSSLWSEEQFVSAVQSSHYFLYGVEEQGKLVAYILFTHEADLFEILNIAVYPSYRRRGYASFLLTELFNLLNSKDDTILEVRSKNIPAIHLYQKFGFKQVGVRKKYYQDNGDDALVMLRAFSL